MSTSKLTAVHVVPSLRPSAGGPSRTVAHLTDALAYRSTAVLLVYQCAVGEPAIQSVDQRVRRLSASSSVFAMKLGLPARAALRHVLTPEPPSILHSHGIWHAVNHWASRCAKQFNIPLVIHPRGMLEPWAMNHKAWKKSLAMALYQQRDLDLAKVLIATSEAECENIRHLGFRQPIAVIPNGVDLSVSTFADDVNSGGLHRTRTVLFLSRIHPKKGILNLLHAWVAVAPKGWRLEIAGPDEGGHLSEVKALARVLGIDQVVEYLGEVDGVAKRQAYSDADLFVLPTFSENFGVVVAEALAHGLPVITTRGAPWSDLETYGCGWWVDIGVDPLVHALREAMALTDDERLVMGARGMAYVRRYDWGDIAQQTIDVYRWVLGQGPQPACVRTD